MIELVKDLTSGLLGQLELKPEKIEIVPATDPLEVNLILPAAESGILIGSHGEMLYSFQTILSLMIYQQKKTWIPLAVNVNNYREERESALQQLALNAAQKVKFSNQSVILSYLSPLERRFVHLALADHPEVKTESVGEGRNRRLMIKPTAK